MEKERCGASCIMSPMVETGIKEGVIEAIRKAAQQCGASRVVLFGSRARGEHRAKSDIDLAVGGGDQVRFALTVEEDALTLLGLDFVDMDGPVSAELKKCVEQEGIVLYEEAR